MTRATAQWLRFAVVHALTAPSWCLLMVNQSTAAMLVAALWASMVCSMGTDSGWKWRNRWLILQAALWLIAALVVASARQTR